MMPSKVYEHFEKLLLAQYKVEFAKKEVDKLDKEIQDILKVRSNTLY